MTLINYLTRVHFADGVLEEALHSEMERHGKRRPLIVAEDGHLTGAMAERFFSSFPIRTRAETFASVPRLATETAAQKIARVYRASHCDHLIAFGSNRAIDLAKVARVAIAYDEPIAALSSEEGGAQRIGGGLPDLFAIPNISGFASAVSDYARVKLDAGGQVLMTSRHLTPTVTICDPTLTLGSAPAASASAASGVISRAIEAYLSPVYNPPADGLAVDGLNRIIGSIGIVLKSDDLVARREMMAGSLNSALSLQKGLCAVHAITNALASVSDVEIDASAVGRIVMPGLVACYGEIDPGKTEVLKRSLRIDPRRSLPEGLIDLMRDYPLPDRLAQMGLTRTDLDTASRAAAQDRAIRNGPRILSQSDIQAMLYAVH